MLIQIKDIDLKVILKAREKRSFFSEKFLGITPYYYQTEVLDDPHPYKAMLTSRQLGKTLTLAIAAVHKAAMFPRSIIAIIAQNENRAFEIYQTVKSLIKSSPALSDLVNPKTDTMRKMTLNNGSVIKYYASGTEGKSIRGDTLDLLLIDEADFIPDPVFLAALPTVSSTGGDVWMTSTPNRKYTFFYNIYQDAWTARLKFEGAKQLEEGELPYEAPVGKEFGFKAWHFDYQHGLAVVNPRTGRPQTDIRLVELAKKKDPLFYEREYLAIWSEETAAFFTEKAIVSTIVNEHTTLKLPKYRVMGLDLGRIHDYTAIVIMEVSDDQANGLVIDTFRIRKNDWYTQLEQVMNYANNYGVMVIYLDENNVGDFINQWLENASTFGLNASIQPLKLSIQSKTRIYNNLKMAINAGKVKIRANQLELLKELKALVAEEAKQNRGMKIHAPHGRHDDLADALALAAQAIHVYFTEDQPSVQFDAPKKEWNYDDSFGDDYFYIADENWGEDIELDEIEPLYEF